MGNERGSDQGGAITAAAWPLGPPAPAATPWLARLSAAVTLVFVAVWVHSYLGGVGAHADVAGDGSVSTDRLFNWHPILMTLGFVVLMSEALLAYRAPWSSHTARPSRKVYHVVLHTLAAVSISFGFAAAWQSHALKVPPIAQVYSPHSFIGVVGLVLLVLQMIVGVVYYLYPKFPLEQRAALGPVHRFFGQAVYVIGLAALAAGLQEKATFLQVFGHKGVRSGFLLLPAVTEVLVALTAVLVLYSFAPRASSVQEQMALQQPAASGEEEGLLVCVDVDRRRHE